MIYNAAEHFVLTPALMLVLFGCAALFGDRRWAPMISLCGLAFEGAALWRLYSYLNENGLTQIAAFQGALTIDRFALFFSALFLVSAAIVVIVSSRGAPEYFGLLLFAQCGMFFLAAGTDLTTLFLGLEVMALCFYVLVGFRRGDRRSNEAAIKYLILGAFSSGVLVYGFSLLYGLSGSTKLGEIGAAVSSLDPHDPLVLLAVATIAAGLLFKISAVPFHTWAPDAYEGAPTPVAAYLAVASKAASIALLMRIFLGPLATMRSSWEPVLSAVAIASMTIGNIAAIAQTNIKRMLAYSSIAHAGYMLLGIVAGNGTGIKGIAVYLLVYTFMTLGAFLVVILGDDLTDLAGLAQRSPLSAVLMVIFLLSLAGLPPTAGFLGKYYLFQALIETGHYTLAAIGTLYVVVALYYYFRIVRVMFVAGHEADRAPFAQSFGLRIALGLSGAFTLGIGLYPEPFLRLAEGSLLR